MTLICSVGRDLLRLGSKTSVHFQCVRNIYKKRYFRGVYVTDGMECHRGDVLVRQWKLNYYPGLNVNYERDQHDQILRASCDGTVMLSTEKINPDFAFEEVREKYGSSTEYAENYARKLTFNVVPAPQLGHFRLKETI